MYGSNPELEKQNWFDSRPWNVREADALQAIPLHPELEALDHIDDHTKQLLHAVTYQNFRTQYTHTKLMSIACHETVLSNPDQANELVENVIEFIDDINSKTHRTLEAAINPIHIPLLFDESARSFFIDMITDSGLEYAEDPGMSDRRSSASTILENEVPDMPEVIAAYHDIRSDPERWQHFSQYNQLFDVGPHGYTMPSSEAAQMYPNLIRAFVAAEKGSQIDMLNSLADYKVGNIAIEYIKRNELQIKISEMQDLFVRIVSSGSSKNSGPIISLSENISKFGFEHFDDELQEALIAHKKYGIILQHINLFPGLDHNYLIQEMLNNRYDDRLSDSLSKLRGLTEETARKIFAADRLDVESSIASNIRSFTGLSKEFIANEIMPGLSEYYDGPARQKLAAGIVELMPTSMPEDLGHAYDIFGPEFSYRDYDEISQLLSGEPFIPWRFQDLGITETGKKGIEQIKAKQLELIERTVASDRMEYDLSNELISAPLMKLFQLGASKWGGQTESELNRVSKIEPGLIKPEYTKQKLIVKKNKVADFEIPVDAYEQYNALRTELIQAISIENPQQISKLHQELQAVASARADELDAALSIARAKNNQSFYDNVRAQQEVLRTVRVNGSFLEDNLATLVKFPELHSLLRKTVLIEATEGRVPQGISDTDISIDDILKLKDYIDHYVVQESIGKRYEGKNYKALTHLFSTKALTHAAELYDLKSSGSNETVTYDIIPSRGAMLELSGQISDACWASGYDSIAQSYPNMTGMIFVKNLGTPDVRFAGAGLLLETTTWKDPLLIIRGLNPRLTDNTQMDQESFVQGIIDYARPIAEAQGRQLAIVIDEVTEASTNRPPLGSYLKKYKEQLKLVRHFKDDTTRFNGYPLYNKVFLIN